MMPSRIAAAMLAACALLASCSAREVKDEVTDRCEGCHSGVLAPAGAHVAHVAGVSALSAPIACEACHVAPDPAALYRHVDGETAVRLGVVANAGGVDAVFADGTCQVYCHGASLGGGAVARPGWSGPLGGAQVACGACHGNPPATIGGARPHPARGDCAVCHPGTLRDDGTIDVAGGQHVDGAVQVTTACDACHGDPTRVAPTPLERAAPPVGTNGETATTALAVGAHQAHLVAGRLAGPISCTRCHDVPAAADHADGTVDVRAELGWTRAAATCATACHGAGLGGGSVPAPLWTGGRPQAECGACHGLPPPSHAAGSTGCAVCHPGTVAVDGTILVAGGLHVNGEVDVLRAHADGWAASDAHGHAANRDLAGCRACHGADLAGGLTGISCDRCHAPGWRTSCTFCHGDANRATSPAAPPAGTQGEVAPTTRAVGAHAAHLSTGPIRAALACTECHVVPADLAHVDGTAAIAFGPLARAGGASPAWDGTSCASTWCHGAALGAGGATTAPAWTAGAAAGACGACHGIAPPPPHPQDGACRTCHPGTMATDTTIDVAGGRHVDGLVQVTCAGCHGMPPPPPHVAIAECGRCHGGYTETSVSSATHRDGTVDVLPLTCTSCHGAPPAAPHVASSDCGRCHEGYTATTVNATLHRNAVVDVVTLTCSTCHGGATNAAPPLGTAGETGTASMAVGAHQRHVTGGALRGPMACSECHEVPGAMVHSDGVRTLTWGALSRDEGAAPSFDGAAGRCSNVYCHGATIPGGGTNKAPLWTAVNGTQAACGTCHALPPDDGTATDPTLHRLHASTFRLACGTCHAGFSRTSVDPALHVNGTRDVVLYNGVRIAGWDCQRCHEELLE